VDAAAAALAASRPTAVNLAWALAELHDEPTPERARRLHAEEVGRCRAMPRMRRSCSGQARGR
jgi:methylthioribose-1-phosphate isomerase